MQANKNNQNQKKEIKEQLSIKNNLPIGLQIIGNYFKEETIYQLASFIEKELNLKIDPRGDKSC